MNFSITLFDVEVGFWPALPLLLLFLVGIVGRAHKRGVLKTWSGKGESNLFSRTRIFLPRLCFFLGIVATLLALANIARSYVVVTDTYATNRLFIGLDNSSSMYKFGGGPPIYCTDNGLKHAYPRIFDACRALNNIVDATENYAKKKGEGNQDEIGILRFGLYSFVELYGTTDYERVRKTVRELNWRDLRTGIYTEIHLALWDMLQVALQRNFRGDTGMVALDENDRLTLAQSLYPEGQNVRYHVPRTLLPKFEAMRADLADTAFIFITDAKKNEFDDRLDKAPVSFTKMMQLAEFLGLPVYVISIDSDHESVRKMAERTGSGPMKGVGRGAFYLIKGEQNFEDIDVIVEKILSNRFRIVSTKPQLVRKSYTSHFALSAICFVLLGGILTLSPFGREITKGGSS